VAAAPRFDCERRGDEEPGGEKDLSHWRGCAFRHAHPNAEDTSRVLSESPSNKRLKLPGGDRFRGSGVLCPGGHELSFNYTARGERVARSLSAIR